MSQRKALYFEARLRESDLAPEAMAKLQESVLYCPETGNIRLVGSENEDDSYISKQGGLRYIKVNGVSYSARRLAYLLMEGHWPANAIFHKDECVSNIRWDNLQESSDRGQRLNQQDIVQRLDYNPATGQLRWKTGVTGWGQSVTGQCGITRVFADRQYLLIGYDGRHYIASTLIWLLVHGRPPRGPITYLDGNTMNNSLENLLEVDNFLLRGTSKLPSNNTSGLKGVWYDHRRKNWQANIKVNGKRIALGRFCDKESAGRAYDKAAIEAWGDLAMTNEKMGLFGEKERAE